MQRFSIIQETWSNVMDSERRAEFAQWCRDNATTGYQSTKALVDTFLGKLRVFLDASVLGHAFANYETLRLFGVSIFLALMISWMVGGAVHMVNKKRRQNCDAAKNIKAGNTKKQGQAVVKKLTFPIGNANPTKNVNDAPTGPHFRPPHPAAIALSGLLTVAFMVARGMSGPSQKPHGKRN